MRFELIGFQIDRGDEIFPGLARAFHRPRLLGLRTFDGLQFQRFHHLADEAIGQHNGGIAITVRELKSEPGQVRHLLHRGGRYDNILVIAMAAALDEGEIVALLRGDISKSRPAAHDVHNHAGKFRASQVRDAFLHQADPRAGGGGHDAKSRRGCAVDHIDGGNFAFRLEKRAADLRHVLGGRFGDFTGWGNRVAVIRPASCQQRALHYRDVALTKLPHGFPPLAAAPPWARSADTR